MTEESAMSSARRLGRWLEHKLVYSISFAVVFLALAGVGLFFLIGEGKPSAQVVRIGVVEGGLVRKRFLEHMAAEGRKNHLDIRLVPTQSTADTLRQVDDETTEMEMGVISGAIEDTVPRTVLEIAPLYMEPLHLLVKADLYDRVSNDYGQLKGRSISMDATHSATSLLATELLRFTGLIDRDTGAPHYTPVTLTQVQLLSETDGSRLPDAVFQLAGMPSPTIKHLISNFNYRLVPLPFGESFNLDRFRDTEAGPAAGTHLRLNKMLVQEFVVPAFAYSVSPPVPPVDTRTLATRLVLIGNDNVDDRLVRRVLEVILSPDVASLARPPLDIGLLSSAFQFARHPGTDRYVSSLQPFDIDGTFLVHERVVEVWGIIIAAYLMVTKGLKAWRDRKLAAYKRSSNDFLREIMEVEGAAAAGASTADREALDQRLSDIKKASIDLQLSGQLEDPENFQSLLVTLADTRVRIWRAPT
jgi:TRAP-type uncharacterized transport system substrate-binding protein